MNSGPGLRAQAEALAQPLPPLLARAQRLAASIQLGEHGRRRPGQGDAFWQYRLAQPGDAAHRIDWRRSARSDHHYVQEKEWQASQTVLFWVDGAASMGFSSSDQFPTKGARAAVIALALAQLLVRGGERVGLAQAGARPGRGTLALSRMAQDLGALENTPPTDLPARSHAVFLSDFLGDLTPVSQAVLTAAERGLPGVLMQVLDPVEEAFPFQGRMIFEDMSGALEYDTHEASDLRDRYLQRLAARKEALAELARQAGWQVQTHHTDDPARAALLWLYHTFEAR